MHPTYRPAHRSCSAAGKAKTPTQLPPLALRSARVVTGIIQPLQTSLRSQWGGKMHAAGVNVCTHGAEATQLPTADSSAVDAPPTSR